MVSRRGAAAAAVTAAAVAAAAVAAAGGPWPLRPTADPPRCSPSPLPCSPLLQRRVRRTPRRLGPCPQPRPCQRAQWPVQPRASVWRPVRQVAAVAAAAMTAIAHDVAVAATAAGRATEEGAVAAAGVAAATTTTAHEMAAAATAAHEEAAAPPAVTMATAARGHGRREQGAGANTIRGRCRAFL